MAEGFTTGGGGGGGGATTYSSPQNQPELVEMFRSLLRKAQDAQQFNKATDTGTTTALIINFDGAGVPLEPGMAGIPQMPTGAFRIIGVHMAAGVFDITTGTIDPVPASAQVHLRQATAGAWSGGSSPLWGASGPPSMVAVAEADIDVTDWLITELQPGDMLPYCLVSFAGAATVLTVTLQLRRLTTSGLATTPLVDENGNPIINETGLDVVNRGV